MKEIKKGFTARKRFEAMLETYSEEKRKNLKVVVETENYILLAAKGESIYLSVITGKPADDMLPEVYINQDYAGTCKIAEINWAAYGSCSAEETKFFIKHLQEAVDFVNQINGKNFSNIFNK